MNGVSISVDLLPNSDERDSSQRGSPACERYGNRRPLSCQPLRPITPSLPTTSVYDKTTPTSYKEQIAAVEEMPRIISSPLPLVIPSKSTSTLPLSILASQDTEEEEDDDDPTPMRKQLKNIVIGPKKEEETVELDPDLLHSEGGSAPVAGKPIELKRIALDRLKRQLATGKNEEIQTWVACSKIVSKERADYFEFVVRSPSLSHCQTLSKKMITDTSHHTAV